MNLHIYKTTEKVSEELAQWLSDEIAEVLSKQEFCTLVLSGGETPKPLFKKLATKEFQKKINWQRVHIFWSDERVVPSNDSRNNAKNAYDLLIDHIDIPANQVHIMRTDIEPNFAVDAYRALLHEFFDNTSQTFDIVLLGMGDDGHTLSLFPGSTIIEDHKHWVNSVYNAEQEMYRITLMPILVNRASKIVFMVEGSGKAEVLKEVLEGEYQPTKLPAQIINPIDGDLHWFLDDAAAKKLSSKGDS
jgi:6-phosphogluconolactonase